MLFSLNYITLDSMYTQNHNNFFLSQYVRMKNQTQKSVALKQNMKKLMTSVLPMVKKMINEKINQMKSGIMKKILPNNLKKRRNTPKRISNRTLKSLENNSRVIATKNIISTPKIVINKPQIVTKPEVVTMSKIVTKPKNVTKLKKVDKPKIVNEKEYDEYKKRVTRQLKQLFNNRKKITGIMIMKNTDE